MNRIEELLKKENIYFSDDLSHRFSSYMKEILEWNEKVNLTNITDKDEFIIKHYIDSLIAISLPQYRNAKRVIDVGTGAGFPGIPLALSSPDKEFYLMDSLLKRLKIIDSLCEKLRIENVTTVHARAEELARNREHRENYDLCVSRAVANLATLSEYCLPFIKLGGYLIAYKGPDAENEISDAKKAIRILGGKIEDVVEGNLEEYDIHHKLIIIKKISNTPLAYPRKAGTPLKEPIR